MFSRKVIIIIVVSLIVAIAIFAVLYRNLKSEKNKVEKQAQSLLEKNGEFDAQSTESQIADLKQSLLYLAKEVGGMRTTEGGSLSPAADDLTGYSRVSSPNLTGNFTASADTVIRLKALEDKLAVLEYRLGTNRSPSPNSSSSPSNSDLRVQYIPLGSATETNDSGGITLGSYEITLDPADFPNYSSISLEVVMRLSESVGELSASFYNYTDGVTISNSTITTSSNSFANYSSGGFRLANGRKTYRLWAKSSQGYPGYLQSARLKINY